MMLKAAIGAAVMVLLVGALPTEPPGEATRERCPLHGQALHRDTVPVRYGMTLFDNGYFTARQKRFPNANTSVMGGCVVGTMGTREAVNYCPTCRVEQASWVKQSARSRSGG